MNKKIMKYIAIIAIILVIICGGIIAYSFISSNKANKSEDIYSKLDSEIAYLEAHLESTINSLNNYNTEYLLTNKEVNNNQKGTNTSNTQEEGAENSKSSSNTKSGEQLKENTNSNIAISTINTKAIMQIDRNNVDWTYIQKEVEKISNAWTIITMDLTSVGTPKNDILLFNDNVANAFKYVKNKDKQNSLISIANLYSLLCKYKDSYSSNKKEKQMLYIKSDIISSYALLDANNWNTISTSLADADTRLSGLINSPENNTDLQKTYVLLKEFIKAANSKDIDLCYMKYFYLIKEFKG